MKVDLPDGHWAEIRDRLNGGDRLAYQDALTFQVTGDGEMREIGAGLQTRQRMALLRRLITHWSFDDRPLPSAEPKDVREPVLATLDLDYLDPLLEAIKPLADRIEGSGKSSKTNEPASTDSSPQDAPPASL